MLLIIFNAISTHFCLLFNLDLDPLKASAEENIGIVKKSHFFISVSRTDNIDEPINVVCPCFVVILL